MVELLAKDDFHLSEEWKTELNRREQALEDGTSVGRPAKSVLAKYRR
ncbi:MAG: addiction module protein [Chitinophagales bacterium]